MTYSTATHQGVVVEEYVTGRILRITHKGQRFKFFAQSEGKASVAIYIGHGELTPAIKLAIKSWAKQAGIGVVQWGRDSEMTNHLTIE